MLEKIKIYNSAKKFTNINDLGGVPSLNHFTIPTTLKCLFLFFWEGVKKKQKSYSKKKVMNLKIAESAKMQKLSYNKNINIFHITQ